MLTLRTLPLRNAGYHIRSNIPVALGVAIGAAVLVGGLLVGDSLRGSLRARALRQLNGVESAYSSPRMIRTELVDKMPGEVIPALMLTGAVTFEPTSGDPRHLARVAVIGLDERGRAAFHLPPELGAVISHRVAERLGLGAGQSISINVEKRSAVPRSSVLGNRNADDVTATLTLPVAAILPSDHPACDFRLTPDPTPAINIFVPLDELQTRLGKPDRVNTLLAKSGNVGELSNVLAVNFTLADYGLRITPRAKGYMSVESDALVLEREVVNTVEEASREIGLPRERTLTYLANTIAAGPKPIWNKDPAGDAKLIPYSVIAALNPKAAPPLGPFLPEGVTSLEDDEIFLTTWPASPLKDLKPGEAVTITYFKPEMEAAIEEATATFRFKGFVPLAGAADDRELTPPFPGVTDKPSIRNWKTPFDGFLNPTRIRANDIHEKYWEKYKATPKAYITLETGERLFGSRFGTVTSIRLGPSKEFTLEEATPHLVREILKEFGTDKESRPQFESMRERAMTAGRGGTDFGVLFLAFSWLLIAAALLLVGLLFRLAIERRAKEVGLLLAAGYSPRLVRRLLLAEGLTVAVVGTAIGVTAAVGYAAVMLRVLTWLWPDPEVGTYLGLHVTPESLVGGFLATMIVAAGTIWFSVRGLLAVPPPALLRGVTSQSVHADNPRRPIKSLIFAASALLVGVGLLAGGSGQADPDLRAMAFFGGGGMLLVAGLLAARALFRWPHHATIRSRGFLGLVALGIRYAGRNPTRSLLTTTLIALASFLLVSVESFRKKPDDAFLAKDGGSGGFRLIAEADVPIFQPFDTPGGKAELLDRLQRDYQKAEEKNPSGPTRQQLLERASQTLDGVTTFAIRVQGGDDASCLNLYQAQRPRVFGVPDSLVARGGFRFTATLAATPEEKANPWLLLTKPDDKGTIPAFAEQNTALFMLKTPLGGILEFENEEESEPKSRMEFEPKIRIVGTFSDSPFQSELIVGDASFRKLYPTQEGFRAFLIDVPAEKEMPVANLLETGLRANGVAVVRTTDKVSGYQKVVGAYLTTFQLLGLFALLLAVLGLGVVILRAVWERSGELALLRAVGYRTIDLQVIVLAETLLILVAGLIAGAGAAIASVLPNVALGATVPWLGLAALGGLVLTAGLAVGGLATASVARAPLVPALRRE